MRIGFNIDELVDWNGQIIFKDAMKTSRSFKLVAADRPAGFWNGFNLKRVPVDWLDANGYPKKVPSTPPGWNIPVRPVTFVFTGIAGRYPGGIYTLRFEGKGRITLTGACGHHDVEGHGGKSEYRFNVDADNAMGICLDIMQSISGDHIRNIEIILPGFEQDNLNTSPFYPPFIHGLKGFSALRFMGESAYRLYEESEPKPVVSWAQRKIPASRSQGGVGITDWQGFGAALEYIVMIANEVNADLWICTGHQWNNDFLSKAALLIKNNLNKNLKVWVEYSNETWNSDMSQYTYARKSAARKGFPKNPDTNEHQWTVYRSACVWDTFIRAFGNSGRIVKVLGGCFADYSLTARRFEYLNCKYCNPQSLMPDILGLSLLMKPEKITCEDTVSSIISKCRSAIARVDRLLGDFNTLAENNGTCIAAYMGGLDIRTDTVENLSMAKEAVRNTDMHALYIEYLEMLERHNIKLLNHPYTGNWGFYGLWGALEYTGIPVEIEPRYLALKEFAKISGK